MKQNIQMGRKQYFYHNEQQNQNKWLDMLFNIVFVKKKIHAINNYIFMIQVKIIKCLLYYVYYTALIIHNWK